MGGGWQSNIKDKQTNKNPWQVTSCFSRGRRLTDKEKDKQNGFCPIMGDTHFYLPVFTSLPFYFAASSPSASSTSHFALIQLCICILNDSITQDPAVKITDVFHYFSPLGHHDPSLAPITPPSFSSSSSSSSIPSLLALYLSPPVLFSSSPTVGPFFSINVPFCRAYLRLRGNNS